MPRKRSQVKPKVSRKKCKTREMLKCLKSKAMLRSLPKNRVKKIWNHLYVDFENQLRMMMVPRKKRDCVLKQVEVPREFQRFLMRLIFAARRTSMLRESRIPLGLIKLMAHLHLFLVNASVGYRIRDQIVALYTLWHRRKFLCNGNHYIHLLRYHVDTVLSTKEARHVIWLWRCRTCLNCVDWKHHDASRLIKSILRFAENKKFVELSSGRDFIQSFLTASEKCLKMFLQMLHRLILKWAPSLYQYYGEICSSAWMQGSDNVRKILGKAIKVIVENILCSLRGKNGFEMTSKGKNSLEFLKRFYYFNDDKTFRCFVTQIFSVNLWRCLKDKNNFLRCNSCEVFFALYPLYTAEDNEACRLKQNRLVTKLLSDTCPAVRAYAAQNVGKILCRFGKETEMSFVNEWLKMIVDNIALDQTSSEVRCGAYICFQEMSESPSLLQHLQVYLPRMGRYFSNERDSSVRAECVKLLLKLKKTGFYKFWNFIPFEVLLFGLQENESQIAESIVSLLVDSYLFKDKVNGGIFYRIMLLLLFNNRSTKDFFLNSRHSLNSEDSLSIIILCLLHVRIHVTENVDADKTYDTVSAEHRTLVMDQPFCFKRVGYALDGDIVVLDDTYKEDIDEGFEILNKHATLNNILVMRGVFDVLAVLLKTRMKQISEQCPCGMNMISELLNKVCKQWFNYFKETVPFDSFILMSSHVPAGNSTNTSVIVNMCLNELENEKSIENLTEYLHVLLRLNQEVLVVELIERLMGAILRAPKTLEGKKQPELLLEESLYEQPVRALVILEKILSYSETKKSIKCNRSKYYDIWLEMRSIQEFVVWRLKTFRRKKHCDFSVVDQFIKKCFKCYVKLIFLLRADFENTCSSDSLFSCLLTWAEKELSAFCPKKLPAESNSCCSLNLLVDLFETMLLVGVGSATTPHVKDNIVEFLISLLENETGLAFAELALTLAYFFYNEAGENKTVKKGRIVDEKIRPLFAGILSAVGKVEDNNLISNWMEDETVFFSRFNYLIKQVCFNDWGDVLIDTNNAKSDKVSCSYKFMDAVVSSTIIPLHVRITKSRKVPQFAEQSELPKQTEQILPLFKEQLVTNKLSEIFIKKLNTDFMEDAETLLAATSFLLTMLNFNPHPAQHVLKRLIGSSKAAIRALWDKNVYKGVMKYQNYKNLSKGIMIELNKFKFNH